MAEYCSLCSPFESYDYNVAKYALKLKKGRSISFLCEGCNIRGIYKDDKGNLFLAKEIKGVIELKPVLFENLLRQGG